MARGYRWQKMMRRAPEPFKKRLPRLRTIGYGLRRWKPRAGAAVMRPGMTVRTGRFIFRQRKTRRR